MNEKEKISERKKRLKSICKQCKNLTNNNRGITLIALVITIIVLLILVGVTINLTIGENGIFKQATRAGEEYSKAEAKEKVSLLLTQYGIEKATNQSSDFANFLRKNLQVGVAQDEKGNYNFAIDGWQVETTENEVISIERLNVNPDKVYPNVASMRADTGLIEGKLVQTESYWDKQYGGSAYYDIVSSTSLTVDDGKCIQLDNGLYAELHPINNTVTVNQFGAYGDGEHDDAEAINKAINAGLSNIQFENSEYRINSRIDISTSNITILGNDATIFYDDDFTFRDDFIIRLYNSSDKYVKNVSLNKLKLIDRMATHEGDYLMIKVMYAENIDIYKCSLEVYSVEGNDNKSATNIDLREYWNNIVIDGCNLINVTNGPIGGNIWVRAGKKGTGNLTMKNNYIKKSCHDETIAIFGTSASEENFVDNVYIDNNTIEIDDTSVTNKSFPVINFGYTTDKITNINFTNNNLTAKAGGRFITIYNAENVLIANNTMNLTSIMYLDYMNWFEEDTNSINVRFEKNNIELNAESSMYNRVFSNIDNINKNTIRLNIGIESLFFNCLNVCENNISIISKIEQKNASIFRISNLDNPMLIQNNTFNINAEVDPEVKEIRFFNFINGKLNGNKVVISNNNVVDNLNGANLFKIFFQSMKDSTPQTIYLTDNNFGNFSEIGVWENTTDYNVEEN